MKRAKSCSVKYRTVDECPRWAPRTQVGSHRGLQVVAVVRAMEGKPKTRSGYYPQAVLSAQGQDQVPEDRPSLPTH